MGIEQRFVSGALLQLHNTPDPDCDLSLAEIALAIFCETLSRLLIGSSLFLIALFVVLGAKHGVFEPSFAPSTTKKGVFRVRAKLTNNTLSARTRPLRALRCGYCVFIKNQGGKHTRKWDKICTVVEALNFDQYNVKVGGSGRITRRNR